MKQDKIEVERDKDGDWRWRYVSSNGKIMADSAEGYKRKQHCIDAVMRVCNLDEFAINNVHESDLGYEVSIGYMYRSSEAKMFNLTVFS